MSVPPIPARSPDALGGRVSAIMATYMLSRRIEDLTPDEMRTRAAEFFAFG
ncbi:MAG: hypothetical protein ACJ768_19030 [Gaiellaceae bacterium]